MSWSLEADGKAAVVDPGELAPVMDHCDAQSGLELVAILATHHHADHVGGVPGLLQRWKVPVFGPQATSPFPRLTNPVERRRLASPLPELGLIVRSHPTFRAIPGRTLPITATACCSAAIPCSPAAAAGCSKARREQLYQSAAAARRICRTTRWCTAGTSTPCPAIRFAEEVEPDNEALRTARQAEEQALRDAGRPTLPHPPWAGKRPPIPSCAARSRRSSLRLTRAYLGSRVGRPGCKCFAALRNWKNSF